MKKIALWIGGVLAVLIIVVVAVPFFIPADTYKRQITRLVEDATGRKLEIKGSASLSIFPSLAIEAKQVTLGNAPGASAPNMVELQGLRVAVQLWPLLSGNIAIDAFVLEKPVINLEVDRNGRPNWEFQPKEAAATTGQRREEPKETSKAGGGASLADLKLGDVRLNGGRVSYKDARNNTAHEISDINVKLALPGLDKKFEGKGNLKWNGKTIEFDIAANPLRNLLEQKITELAAKITSEPVKLAYQGAATLGKQQQIIGKIDLDVPSIRNLAAWAGQKIAMPGDTLGPLKVTGALSAIGDSYAFKGAKFKLDAINADGDFEANLAGAKPVVKARLAVDMLDLNPYLGEAKAKSPEKQQAAKPGADAKGPPSDWSDDPIDFSALKSVDADLTFETGGLKIQEIKIGKTKVKVDLVGGKLTTNLTEMALYDGTGKATIVVDSTPAVPTIKPTLTLAGLKARAFLNDAAGMDSLEGTANAEIDLAMAGKSQRQIVSSLAGKGKIAFLDGAIIGINLADMVRNVSTAFLGPKSGAPQKTDFAELSGSFTASQGILKNEDLQMKAPLIRLDGKGTVGLPKRDVNYHLVPKFVASIEGQGGRDRASGVSVPVLISGPWHDISYKPDLAGLLGDAAKDPVGAARGLLEGLRPGSGGPATTPPAPGAPSPRDAIRGLFNR